MTDIEKKALALVNEVMFTSWLPHELERIPYFPVVCRVIEQHEAFRQEVSDAVQAAINDPDIAPLKALQCFIIAKPDPLVEAWIEATGNTVGMEPLNEALAKRGGKIVWEND